MLVSLLLTCSRRFVIQIYLSTPCIAPTRGSGPGAQKILHEIANIRVSGNSGLLRPHSPNEGIRAMGPKNITQNSQYQGFWKFWPITAERRVCCCVWMRTVAVSFYSLVNLCIRSARRNLGYREPERNAPIKRLNFQEIAYHL